MKALSVAALWMVLLVGCGGGGGGDGPFVWPAVAVDANSVTAGTLQVGDHRLPDGTFADLYKVTLATPTTLTILLESVDFDAYLFLFDGVVLGIADLNAWEPHLRAENDDIDFGITDARIDIPLAAGTYAIVANSFFPGETGNYTLTLSTPDAIVISSRYLQYRNYETAANNRFQGWLEFRVNGPYPNIDAFHEAFETQPGDGMWLPPEARVRIW